MERETGFEPATSSLGIQTYIKSKSIVRFCRDFLNLQHLAESAFSEPAIPIEAQMRQVFQPRDRERDRWCSVAAEESCRTISHRPGRSSAGHRWVYACANSCAST